MSRTFQSLKHFNFRLWFFSNMTSATGVWMQRVAQDWVVLTYLTKNSGFAVGVTTALQFAPVLLISPFAGVLADRLDRRKILIVSQSVMAALAAIIGTLLLTGHAALWQIYLLAFAGGIMQAFSTPARQAFVNEMVPMNEVANAVSLNSLAFNIARMIGPALAGVAIQVFGPGWVFIVNMVLFIVPIIAMLQMRTTEFRELPRIPRKKGQIREGIRYVRQRSDIVVIMVVVSTVSALGLNYQLTSAVMAKQVYGRGAGGYGLLGTCLAIGAVIGALLAARRREPRVRGVLLSAFTFGVIAGILALAPNYYAFAAISIPLGIAQMTMITSANAAIQVSTEPRMIGRVMSLYSMVFLGTTPLGAPIVGWVSEAISPRWSIGVGAVASIAIALLGALWAWRAWDVHLEHRAGERFVRIVGPRERREDAAAATDEQDETTVAVAEIEASETAQTATSNINR